MEKDVLISVSMPTYGQEKFLSEAILGILSQEVNYSIELIVSDDCSPDNTESVVKNIIKTHPNGNWIKYIRHTQNKGAIPNFAWTLSQAKGKYIAICEGDDYWTDPLKLQKQVDFLEKNEDCVLCFHKVKILKPTGEFVDDFITKIPENFELRETLAKKLNYIHTPSVLFRNVIQNEVDTMEFKNSPIGDYFLYMMLTKYGKIGYLEDSMAVYRYGVGIFSSLNRLKHIKANILLFTNLYGYEKDPVVKEIFYQHLQDALSLIDEEFQKNDRILNSRRHKLVEKIYRFLKK